ncbi:KIF-1 Hypothetical protein protein C terminal [Nesidiocoris tenuis]|uniref:KIF-binding protein n=2 Tax=Nesidiocoris tenuis TaxID=355587 RepID=A0ABN7ASI5_9HEMI|nr:KIF-1 Hypothetical protein protein C terminal [Nesidiocoris tenuis]
MATEDSVEPCHELPSIASDWREGIKKRYLRAEQLLTETKDAPTQPYKSKYEARELLRELVDWLRSVSDERIEGVPFSQDEINAMLVRVLAMVANVDSEVEEPASAEKNLNKALSLLDFESCDSLSVTGALHVLNQLGLLWSMREDHERALGYLQKAENLYGSFVSSNVEPLDTKSFFTGSTDGSGQNELELLYTHTLYFLAQVFKALKMNEKAALYCHATLKKQLERGRDYNKIEWAINAATLSQYLAERYAFKEARHHLAAAEYVMQAERAAFQDIPDDSDEHAKLRETLEYRGSDVARCWVKYCLLLFCASRERLMGSDEDSQPRNTEPPKELIGLGFPSLDVKEYENVSASYVLDYDDAKKVFLFAQKCCNSALEYNTLDGHVTDHVIICQDLSKLFEFLAFYDDNEDNQSKMHKRRIDLLSKVVTALNSQYYLELCRSLWLELGSICLTMAEIKLSKLNSSNRPEPKLVTKCNTILQNGVDHVEKYIRSYDDMKTQGPPLRYPDEVAKEVISAHLLAANMYLKFVSADGVKLLYYNTKSLDLFKYVVEYCERNSDFKELEGELHLAKQMELLLPAKLSRISARINDD